MSPSESPDSCGAILALRFTRLPWNSRSAAKDPFRRYIMMGGGTKAPPVPEAIDPSAAYTAWAARYLHDFDRPRVDLGRVALNMRANAARNPKAVMRTPR